MLRLVISICLLGVAGLVIVGGCTPEADRTWSETADVTFLLGGAEYDNITGTYTVTASLDKRFTSMTLYHTGSTLQGFDNMRRTWMGSISGWVGSDSQTAATGGGIINLETSDGPSGTEVIVGNVALVGGSFGIVGQHWASPRTGTIQMVYMGSSEDEEEEEEE